MLKCLFLGDIVGKHAKDVVIDYLKDKNYDLVIVNGENICGGKGITRRMAKNLLNGGVDIITSGNHIWIIPDIFEEELNVLKPANYYELEEYPIGGKGFLEYTTKNGVKVMVVNIIGVVFMGNNVISPFVYIKQFLENHKGLIIVDFHAEATAEKKAMGFYLDGKVAALLGTHTHVQTSDETILPGGTAYITDVGMCGPTNSVIGAKQELALKKFFTGRNVRLQVEVESDIAIEGVILEIDEKTNKTLSIKRVREYVS